MKLVIIESPYAGDIKENRTYARRALADSLARGEAPFASHLLYTQPGVLDDLDPNERKQGIEAGLAWGKQAELTAVYIDHGMSRGMELGVERAVFRRTTGRDSDRRVMSLYYQDEYVTLYHAKCEEEHAWLAADVMVSDVPYGVAYNSGARRDTLAKSIDGDLDTSMRDYAIAEFRRHHGDDAPMLIFGSPRITRPSMNRQTLIWDTKGALGMGALDIPWKPAHQEIYVLGKGFHGRRSTDVLVHAPVQSTAKNGRLHPHQKPIPLMQELLTKCPPGIIGDPFSGSGSTLVAAKALGLHSIGVELKEEYCETTAKRCQQEALIFTAS